MATSRRRHTTIGPVEYIIVGFRGDDFNGAIAPALADLIDNKTIRILDLVFVGKDADGDMLAFEFDELGDLTAKDQGVLTDEEFAAQKAAILGA